MIWTYVAKSLVRTGSGGRRHSGCGANERMQGGVDEGDVLTSPQVEMEKGIGE